MEHYNKLFPTCSGCLHFSHERFNVAKTSTRYTNNNKDALLKMLNLNQNSNPESDVAIAWKVLIYDKHCQDIISPVLRLGDLREQGITLHM
jgi:hypothetical protein